jgi:serine/threonine protein kinase
MSAAPAPAPAPPNTRTYEVLGKGSYGVVLQPAFNNINAEGNPVSYPNNVVKVLEYNEDYDKSMSDYEILKAKVPNMVVPYYPYIRKFKGKNVANISVTNKKNTSTKKLSNTMPMIGYRRDAYAIRMPYLGDSIKDVYTTSEKYKKYGKFVPKVLLEQIYKLMNIVKRTKDAGYIHGDIRDTNVMANVNTGVLTIIDFDWLKPRDEFSNEYPQPFYSIPPESCIFLKEYDEKILQSNSHETVDSKITFALETYYKPRIISNNRLYYPYELLFENVDSDKAYTSFSNEAKEGIKSILNIHNDTRLEYLKNKFLDTIDSFGLAVTLCFLADKAIPLTKMTRLLIHTLKTLFRNMAHPNIDKRITIEEAIDELKGYIDTYHKDIDLTSILPPVTGAVAAAPNSFANSNFAKSIRAALAAPNNSGAAGGTTSGGRRRARKTRRRVRKHAKKSRGKSRKN